MLLTKLVVKTFNAMLLREEMQAAGLLARIESVVWAGFAQAGNRYYAPLTEPTVIGSSSTPGGVTEDIAQPGEFRFNVPADFSPAEESALDGVLAAHDYTQITAEQGREEQDVSDWQALYNNWPAYRDGTLNAAQQHQYETMGWRLLLRLAKRADV